MRLDVFFTPGEVSTGEIAGRTVVVIDVIRASSTVVEALAAGAKAIYPVASIEEALRLANTFGRDEVLLCGERKCVPIEGFNLGNSPREFTSERVGGKTLVMSTTNGTLAINATAGAAKVVVGSLLNLGAVVDELAASEAEPVILCSGRERHFAIEDAVTAGYIAEKLLERRPGEWRLNDGARAALSLAATHRSVDEVFAESAAGQAVAAAGFGEDLPFCAQTDRHSVVPVFHDRQITLAAPLPAVTAP